jgi:PhnB protein
MAVEPVPKGYSTITPYLSLDDASGAIEFYKQAFGATEGVRMPTPDGKVGHAELKIGDSMVMLSDMFPQSEGKTPKDAGGTTVSLFMYVEDVDASFKRAVDAGATSSQEPEDQFWGDRYASVVDPYGHRWLMATHVEDIPPEEMEERAKQAMASTAAS